MKGSSDVRGSVESGLTNLREALKGEDADRIKKAMENLQASVSKIGEQISGAAGAPVVLLGVGPGHGSETVRDAAGGPQPGNKDDDVIDAEYEVKE